MTEKRKRGFAVMSPELVSEIASKGGKAAHAKGTAHKFNREEAIIAGRKGGRAAHSKKNTEVSLDPVSTKTDDPN